MSGVFAWLNEAMLWIGQWIPRLLIVLSSERGIRYRNGRDVAILEPGLRVYWPIATKCQVVNVMRQVLNLSTQTLTTKDGKPVIVSGLVVYRIEDVELYLVDNHDADAGIDEVTCAEIRTVLIGLSLEEVQAERTSNRLDGRLKRAAAKSLKPFGVAVEECRLTDFAPARVLSIAGTPVSVTVNTGKEAA